MKKKHVAVLLHRFGASFSRIDSQAIVLDMYELAREPNAKVAQDTSARCIVLCTCVVR